MDRRAEAGQSRSGSAEASDLEEEAGSRANPGEMIVSNHHGYSEPQGPEGSETNG